MRERKRLLPLLAVLAGLTACTDPCLDDGLFQDDPANCAAQGGSSGDAEQTCDNGVKDPDETDVDCGGVCEARCPIDNSCAQAEDCESDLCNEGTCSMPPSCDDGMQNPGETDVDCGGDCGPTCGDGNGCGDFLDCDSLVCDAEANTCASPTCDDGAPNGSETDVDCGGPDCDPCPNGGGCTSDSDCASASCDPSGECVATHCTNGELDGSETDVDCGGPDCAPCDGGQTCEGNGDCVSESCEDGTCTTASCDDGIQNAGETDVDCGGPTCDACSDGGECETDTDCASGHCDPAHEVCEAESCTNGVQDGDETDVDCGGPSCAPCDDGESCNGNTDCESESCSNGSCQPASCTDGVHNGNESDVDCGGDTCGPCDDGNACILSSDCESGVCLLEECQPPACDDGVQNGDETDTDCGGACGATCEVDESCTEDEDCASAVCDPTTNTCAAPACDDGAHNGDETDVDCGGSCEPCAAPGMCLEDSDCLSSVCDSNTCAPASCRDGVLNGTETDIDCGGDACGPCDDGETCEAPTDCVSAVCTDDTCVTATCDDGVQNGTETDIDCGGDTCGPCDDGEQCTENDDCVSEVCDPVAMTCEAAACNDGVLNGNETDVDCGGPDCSGCDTGEVCNAGTDCASQICDPATNTCTAPACDDGVLNGDETDIDCGGDTCGPCGTGETCEETTDCVSMVCLGDTCQASACDDGVQNGDETDTDCGGSCQPCDDGEGCGDATDCVSMVCDPAANTCTAATCSDGVQNQGETDVDCGGPACNACPDGGGCNDGSDCTSMVCDPATNTCSAPACDDGVHNGDETDNDCGGSCGATCQTGEGCDDGNDCAEGVCDPATLTCSAPTCGDGVRNGTETDVDCGGLSCDGCDTGETCNGDMDCASMVCNPATNTCDAPACDDGVQNGDETDTDCGGSCGATCQTDEGCDDGDDCAEGVCDPATLTCSAPTCGDGVQNGDETDTDCGGSCGATCTDGEACDDAADCVSGVCDPAALTCTPPSCGDGVQNGDETDTDCGGSCGATCEPGESCTDGDDCMSAGCDGGTCNAPLSVVITPNACGDAAGGSVMYTAVASGGTGGPYTFAWTPDDGTIDDPTSATVEITPPDYASYTVTANDGVNTADATGVVVLSNQAFNLQDNCTLYQGGFGGAPATITYSGGGTIATEQGNNGLGLHLCEGVAFANTRLTGSFSVNTTNDDDIAGFVWGAQDSSHFYILSWKQGQQNFPCNSGTPEGMTVKRIFAPDFDSITANDLYCPSDTPNSEFLLGPADSVSTGWLDNTSYTIQIDYTPGGSEVTVTNDATNTVVDTFDVDDTTYQTGFFGSHTISQEQVAVGPMFGSCL